MIIRLTTERLRYCQWAVQEYPPIQRVWEQEQVGKRWDVCLPAIAWLYISERLLEMVYNPRGQKRHTITRPGPGALKDVRKALNTRELHPAMRGAGVLGWVGDIFPAWSGINEGELPWVPYPNGGTFAVLVPQHLTLSGRRVTQWSPSTPPVRHHLLEEGFHLSVGLRAEGGRIHQHGGAALDQF